MADHYNLHRFVDAQESVFGQVVAELRAGCKIGHWMWFIFPQLRGLGSSPAARRFGISGLPEAQAYLCLLYTSDVYKRQPRLLETAKRQTAVAAAAIDGDQACLELARQLMRRAQIPGPQFGRQAIVCLLYTSRCV